jgi:predicted negative regulator of RcsB-dependent stress response
VDGAPQLMNYLGEVAEALRRRARGARRDGPAYRINPRLVRGMDYYNLTVFEWVTDKLGAQGTICGGGRYDGLIELIGGKPAPAVGWGMGIERVLDLLQQEGLAPAGHTACGLCRGARCRRAATRRGVRGRGAACGRGQRAAARRGKDGPGSMKSQFKKADASGARYALVFGGDELARGEVSIKPLRDAARPQTLARPGCGSRLGGRTAPRIIPVHRLYADNTSMATSLDLQEQEQLDALKAFWKQYGNLITWVLILALGALRPGTAGTGTSATRPPRPARCSTSSTVRSLAGDADKAGRIFNDLKDPLPAHGLAQQGGWPRPRLQFDKGQADAAKATLAWLVANATEDEYKTLARLRLAGVLLEAKQYDEALKQLDDAKAPAFEALVADRRGDILLAQGKPDAARQAFQAAWAAMDDKLDYKRLVEAKLVSLAAPPVAAASAASGAAK